MDYRYLHARVFRLRNRGPRVTGGSKERNPSVAQIKARCAVVQTSWTARTERLRRSFPHEHGLHAEDEIPDWTPPVVVLSELSEFSPEDLATILKLESDPA